MTWSELVAAAPPSLVLPDRARGAAVDVPGPLQLLDALDLGDGHAVAVVQDGDGGRWTVPLVRDGDAVRRARPGDGTAARLVAALRTPAPEPFAVTAFHVEDVDGEEPVTVDQTNESVVVGGRAVVKWAVRLPRAGEPGSPAPQRVRALAAAGFADMPAPWGLLEHGDVLLAGVAGLLAGALDGWDWAVEDVRALARGDIGQDESLDPARRIGAITARMHAALAAAGREPLAADDAAAEARASVDELDEALALVQGDEGGRLRARAARIRSALEGLAAIHGTPVIDVHGDYHVGQVLRHGSPPWSYAVTDFDGSPVLPPSERIRRRPAAVDVAGMMASLDHVGRVVLFRTEGVDVDAVQWWIDAAQAAFLDAYRGGLDDVGCPDLLDDRLLLPLRLRQEVREHLYAVRHLPHWVYVPDMALTDLLPDED